MPPDRTAGGGSWWRPIALPGQAAREEILRQILDIVPEGMAVLDREGRILHGNPALQLLVGPLPSHPPGAFATDLLAPEHRHPLREHLRAVLSPVPGAPEPLPLRAVPADPMRGEDAEWSLRCRALPEAVARGGAAALLHIEDRSERRRAEARLAAMARLEMVGQLAGGIAHDFNNLLVAVMGAAEAMRTDQPALGPAAAEELRTIEDAAARGAALVKQLLAFARQQHLQPRVLELNAAVQGVAPLLQRLLGPRIRLELALEEPGRPVRVDPAQLDQVVLNLASNAREAMPRGGRLRIATSHAVVLRPEGEGPSAIPPGRYEVLEVTDTGTGIPPEVLPRLFEPFFTTRPDRGGTGLGLATVQGIVAQSGGHITVASRVGEGTTFRIHLPRHPGTPGAQPAIRSAPPVEAPAPVAPPPPAPGPGPTTPAAVAAPEAPSALRILLVEDEAPIRRLAERLMQRAGHQVEAADSAEAALEALESGRVPPPDLLVSDVAMPGADGLTLARMLRGRWPALPVLLMSGYAEVTLGQDLEKEGLRLLQKPFSPAEFVSAVAEVGLRPPGHSAP